MAALWLVGAIILIAEITKRPSVAALWFVGAIILIAEITKRPSVAALFNMLS